PFTSELSRHGVPGSSLWTAFACTYGKGYARRLARLAFTAIQDGLRNDCCKLPGIPGDRGAVELAASGRRARIKSQRTAQSRRLPARTCSRTASRSTSLALIVIIPHSCQHAREADILTWQREDIL